MNLVVAVVALGQPISRERGRFSIQGSPPTAFGTDLKMQFVLAAFESGSICIFPFGQKVVALHSFAAHKKPITGAAFLPDGESFITCSSDGTVKVWDTLAARKHHQEKEKDIDSKPPVPTPTKTINAHIGPGVFAMALSADGKTLITVGTDYVLKVWDVAEGTLKHTVKEIHSSGMKALVFAADGKHFATAAGDKSAKWWALEETGPKMLYKLDGHEGAVNSVSISTDGKHLATASGTPKKIGTIRVWDTATGKVEYKLEGSEDVVTALLFSQDGDLLVSGANDQKIRVWNLSDKTQKHADEHVEALRGFVITPDGKYFGSWSKSSIRWWAGITK